MKKMSSKNKLLELFREAVILIGLLVAVLFLHFIISEILEFLQDIFVVHPSKDEIIFRTNYLFLVANFIILITLFGFALYSKKRYKRQVLRWKLKTIKAFIFIFILGGVASLYFGGNDYIKIHKCNDTITASSGIVNRDYFTYGLDDLRINKSIVHISGGKYPGRYIDIYGLEFPNGKKFENIDGIKTLVAMLDRRVYGRLIIYDKQNTYKQDVVANIGNFIDWATLLFTPYALYLFFETSRRRKILKAEETKVEKL